MPQSWRHETVTPGPAVATRDKRFATTVSAALHSLKARVGYAAHMHTEFQRRSSRIIEARNQPVTSVEHESIATIVSNGSSTYDDIIQETSSTKSLCAMCIDLNRLYEVAQSPTPELEYAAVQYKNSSREGCPGCAAVVRFLFKPTFPPRIKFMPLGEGETIYGRMRSLLNSFYMRAYGYPFANVVISGFPDCLGPWSEIEARAPIPGNTGSDQAVAWVRGELDTCLSQHSACAHTERNPLPSRVLRINGPEDVRLYVTANEISHYVCLSHCWGTLPVITTTSLTLGVFQQQIPWEQLPKTFQDAVSFTFRLGYMYLWIDSLCIVQDSTEDWRHEGSKMASIYRNSSLTLAATSSSDSRGGCFVKTTRRHRSRKWAFRDAANNAYKIHSRLSLDHTSFMEWRLPLLTRAWAFQERLLSPRVLHFTDNELIWECSEQISCQCSSKHDRQWGPTHKTALRPGEWQDEPLVKIDRQWQEIVSSYTLKDLTFDKDIFPALQGLAKMMPSKMGPYMAGLWKNTLASNLTWYVLNASSEARLEAWRAPSWSWASTTKSIRWATNLDKYQQGLLTRATYITVLDANVAAVGEDTTGEIISGEILVRGRVLFGKLHAPDKSNPSRLASLSMQFRSADGIVIDVTGKTIALRDLWSVDGAVVKKLKLRNVWLELWRTKSEFHIFWDHDVISVVQDYGSGCMEILALRIEEFTRKVVSDETVTWSAWLLLKRRSEDSADFERVGLLQVQCFDVFEGGKVTSILDHALQSSPLMDIKIV